MSFSDWKKRTKILSRMPWMYEKEAIAIAQAAYKAGERAGLKTGEDIAKRAIELRELMRSNVL
jgi:hypothetical protein